MSDKSYAAVTVDEAAAFAERMGLAWATSDHLEALARAMTMMNAAGRAVPRVASKMTQPAHVYRVRSKLPRA